MGEWKLIRAFSDTSPAAAGVAASARTATGCDQYQWLRFTCIVIGGTGGTTDITVQTKLSDDLWADWARTAAVAATVTTKYTIAPEASTVISTIGTTNDALTAYTVVLAAGTCVGGHPGHTLRLVYTAGVGTSAGAAQVVYLHGWKE